jgi:hypothetical protein
VLALAYLAFMSTQIVLIYQNALEGAVAAQLPHPLAVSLGWGLAGLFLLVVGLGAVHEIHVARGERRASVLVSVAGVPGPATDLERQECSGGEEVDQLFKCAVHVIA